MMKFFYLFLKCLLLIATTTPLKLLATTSSTNYRVHVVTEYLEPYQIREKDGTLSGFSTEVIHALFKQANSIAEISVMPWARAYEIAKMQKNTLIYSIARTPKREKSFHWIGSLKTERLYFWGLKSKFPFPIDTYAILKGYRIAASRNSNVSEYLFDNNFFNIYQLNEEDQNMKLLYRERVDLIIATELTLKKRAIKLGLDFNLINNISEVKALHNDLSIAFSLDSDPAMVKHFQQAFHTIKQKGLIKKIKKKWGID